MIHTAKQLKDKVRNLSKSDNDIAKVYIRNFFMERFLERVSLSEYRDHFILKGGMLVASIVGINLRATMDIDTSVKAIPLNEMEAKKIITEICAVKIPDSVSFQISSVKEIMSDFEYPGVRIMMEATLERMRQTIKLDLSTDDVITPGAVRYEYPLMFEERKISVMAYNPETILAEKLQTILSRGIANTRMRDFYDVYELLTCKEEQIDKELMREAFAATCQKRKTSFTREEIKNVVSFLENDDHLEESWKLFRKKHFFVRDIKWETVIAFDIDVILGLM